MLLHASIELIEDEPGADSCVAALEVEFAIMQVHTAVEHERTSHCLACEAGSTTAGHHR
jgi:hypothetical protein